MSFLNFFKQPNIQEGLEQYKATAGAILLDVRTPEEYAEGRIPGSKNLPLQSVSKAASVIPKKDTPLYVYCHSGARSDQAVQLLIRMGYTSVKNIGGIASYKGKVEV